MALTAEPEVWAGFQKKRAQATSEKATVQALLSEDRHVAPGRGFQPKGQKKHGRASQGGS
jgi:hypothetical protein